MQANHTEKHLKRTQKFDSIRLAMERLHTRSTFFPGNKYSPCKFCQNCWEYSFTRGITYFLGKKVLRSAYFIGNKYSGNTYFRGVFTDDYTGASIYLLTANSKDQ